MLTKRFTGRDRAELDGGSSASEDVRTLAAALDERDVAIASLERTLAEQQAHIQTLRDTLERAKFQTRILERSYSTQLGEARARAAAAEQSAADLQTRIAALEASHEKLTGQLTEARAALDSFGPAAAPIDEMLASSAAPRDRPLVRDSEREADAPDDPQGVEEMLAPDVMFAGKGK